MAAVQLTGLHCNAGGEEGSQPRSYTTGFLGKTPAVFLTFPTLFEVILLNNNFREAVAGNENHRSQPHCNSAH